MADEKNVKIAAVAAGAGLLLLGTWFFWGGRPPQVGGDKESLRVIEALFTAVGSRNTTRLSDCEERLHALRDAGQLASPAADYLDRVIQTARAGKWRPAAEELFNFLKGQRH
jgi:hypothetical protein